MTQTRNRLEQCFKLPEKDSISETSFFIMKNGKPSICLVTIKEVHDRNNFKCIIGYDIVSYLLEYINDNGNLKYDCTNADELYRSYVPIFKDFERDFSKNIWIHVKEALRISDSGHMINRLFGVLSYRFIRKCIDEFIIECGNCTEQEFAIGYGFKIDSLLLKLNTKASESLKAIKNDYISANLLFGPMMEARQDTWQFPKGTEKSVTATWDKKKQISKDKTQMILSSKCNPKKSIKNLWGLLA